MKRFITICQVEFVLFIRDFFGFFFTLVFPTMMLVLFGSIYGNNPIYPGAEVGMIDVSVPAYCVMVIGVTGLMSLPLTLAEYKEKKIYKRFDATPVGKKSIMVAQVCINIVMTFAGFFGSTVCRIGRISSTNTRRFLFDSSCHANLGSSNVFDWLFLHCCCTRY